MDIVSIDRFLQNATMTSIFITDVMFEEMTSSKRSIAEDAINWCELPVNVIYQVKYVIPVQTKFSATDQVLIVLNNEDGSEIKVWSPRNVNKDLKAGIKTSNNAYIKSLGQKIRKTASGRCTRYYDFETVYI